MNNRPARKTYVVCSACTAKLFGAHPPACCPRCGGRLLPPVAVTPPWRRDGRAARGAGGADVSQRRGARYDLRALTYALARGERTMQTETEQLATVLARDCRVMTARQAAAFFPSRRDPLDCARRAARTLVRLGLATAQPSSVGVVAAEGPLVRCTPEGVTPNLAAVAWQNQRRWRDAKPGQAVCLVATPKARLALGGTTRPPRPRELEHDLTVTAVYLQLLVDPLAGGWRHEDAFPPQRGERPDATYERDGVLVTVEVLGRGYTRPKIERIWRAWPNGPLELW